jgi:spore maturation protein CgeB
MPDRLKTLILYANGAKWQAITIDTLLRGVFRFQPEQQLPSPWFRNRWVNKVLGHRYEMASYIDDWMEAFRGSSELETDVCNISNLFEYRQHRKAVETYPLIIVLHSATHDDMWLLHQTANWFKARHGKLLVFLGNEYNYLPQKIGFLRDVQADYVGSQLPTEAAQWLYKDSHTQVLSTPHALNPHLYHPQPGSYFDHLRPIDIGFIGDRYPYYIGDNERTGIIEYFQENGSKLGLNCDIRFQRLRRGDWAQFLQTCKGIIGAESGTYYLEKDDRLINKVMGYTKTHPSAPFEAIYDRFFRDYPHNVSGKAISSRHFEAIGAQTCQLLLEGRYNDILIADQHYIAVKKDYSNIDDAVARFKDSDYRAQMVTKTYEYVLANHTYAHRIGAIVKTIKDQMS